MVNREYRKTLIVLGRFWEQGLGARFKGFGTRG